MALRDAAQGCCTQDERSSGTTDTPIFGVTGAHRRLAQTGESGSAGMQLQAAAECRS